MKKLGISLILLFLFLFPYRVFASDTDYTITNYNIEITVRENNILDIEEYIAVNFTKPRHGIYRKIPLTNKIERVDGTKSTVKAKITQIQVNDSYKIYKESGNQVIQIGSANSTVIGNHSYIIKYSYDLGRDKNKGFDEFYYNIIGPDWETSISNINFIIHMPKEFDRQKFGISTGRYGVSGSGDVIIAFSGNDIKGTVLRTLNRGEAVTARIELENGYFVRPIFTSTDYVAIAIPPFFVIIGVCLWKKYGADDPIVETVEFYPPDNLNSAEVGYIYKNKAENKDVVSLLIYFAGKKYLTIEETKNKDIIFKKLRDYDETNEIEKEFFEGLFKQNTLIVMESLKNNFYDTTTSIKEKLKKLREKIYSKKADNIRNIIKILIALAILAPMLYLNYKQKQILGLTFIYILAMPFFLFDVIIFRVFKKSNQRFPIYMGLIGLEYIILAIAPVFSPVLTNLEEISSLCIILSILCSIIALTVIHIYMPKRTPYGAEIIGKIKGFRKFLETAEKEKLEQLVMQDPEYFYNILPYTYVLGLSDKWIQKFESITVKPPEWYENGFSTFDIIHFSDSINQTITSATKIMTTRPAPKRSSGSWSGSSDGGFSGGGSSGGSFSGGGGFSGGGSGGGGGGAW